MSERGGAGERRDPLVLAEIAGQLPYASNTTVLAVAGDGSRWVYKPETGEQPLWDFPWGSLAAREVLAHETSAAMGLGIVPLTVEAVGPLGPGSAQRFLNEDEEWDPRTLLRPSVSPELWPFAVLDIVINNADRKLGHLLREEGTGRIWAIDNGLSFHPLPKLRTVLWGFSGRPLPDEMVRALDRLTGELERWLCGRVSQLLGPREAEALARRVDRLLAHPFHPEPPQDRPPVPWPVW